LISINSDLRFLPEFTLIKTKGSEQGFLVSLEMATNPQLKSPVAPFIKGGKKKRQEECKEAKIPLFVRDKDFSVAALLRNDRRGKMM
jgi:hypothetical protein